MAQEIPELFDPALDDMELDFQLGVRKAGPRDAAASILATVSILERLDIRPMEWVAVPRMGGPQSFGDDTLPRTVEELAARAEAGARKDDAGSSYPEWGYFIQVLSFLEGTNRGTSPFHAAISDGKHDGSAGNSFSLEFEHALIPAREALVDCFVSLVQVWHPERGGVFGYEVARLRRGEAVWYPPVGALTYFAHDSGYVLPESPLVELRLLSGGVLAVLNDWTLDAVLSYADQVRAVNQGIPRTAGHMPG